jgi:serine/threonine protein kinase/SH3-like domain-containing protein
MPLSTGQVLQDRYRIDALLGQGGMGAVYRGTDLRFNTSVAIKENRLITPESQKQFAREAGLLHRLRHPNLPRVSDHLFIPGQGQYLVMDFIEGEDLDQVLARLGRVPQGQALNWIGQVLDALEYLHSQDIIHRDVKPANVKITPGGWVFLVDFGLAKTYDPGQQTTIGARGVTPGFAPPEQYGQGRTDARTDVYSTGATLYALVTGQAPPDSLELVTRQATLIPPRRVNPKVSPEVEAAILQSMKTAPGDRFRTAAEFWEALPRPSQTRPVSGKKAPSTDKTPISRPPPYWFWLTVGGAGALLLAIVMVALVLQPGGESQSAIPEATWTNVLEVSAASTASTSEIATPTYSPSVIPTPQAPETAPPTVRGSTPTPVWSSTPSPTPIQVVGPFIGQVVAVRVPVADIWPNPRVGGGQKRETQVLMGEPVEITGIQESWYRVVVLDQPSSKDPRGYPGWIEADDVTLMGYEPEKIVIVTSPSAALRQAPAPNSSTLAEISLDTRLKLVSKEGDWFQVELPDGGGAWIESSGVRIDEAGHSSYVPSAQDLVQTAMKLLRTPYMWGGSSWQALDCSGVVYRTFHAHGIVLARDSRDQARGGRVVAREDLLPGDLVFYAVGGTSGTVSHVGLYIGDGMAIATYDGQYVRKRRYDDPTYGKDFWGARRYW